MRIEMDDNSSTATGVVAFFVMVLLVIVLCTYMVQNANTQQFDTAVKAGLQQKQNTGTPGFYWSK